jgi:uncharacterized UPF0160 family protein
VTLIADKIPRSVGTHDGTFHADEVTACALLILFDLVDKDKVIRTRDPARLKICEYVCDVGGDYEPLQKLFDHHQFDYQGSFSSAGMILLYLKEEHIITAQEYDFFNHALIHGVDDHDNGKAPLIPGICSFSNVISNFAPIPYEVDEKTQNIAFTEALNFVIGHLKRLWDRYKYNQQCKAVVSKCMEKYSDCLIFDKGIPWQDSFFELGGEQHTALFVIMPSDHHWKLRGIPPNTEDRMSVRMPLPLEWAGLSEAELKKASGIEGSIFCHKGRFISVWETKEDALKALEYVLKKR